MAHIQMTDRNPSDLRFMEELTDEELLAINGGRVPQALISPPKPPGPFWSPDLPPSLR